MAIAYEHLLVSLGYKSERHVNVHAASSSMHSNIIYKSVVVLTVVDI